MKGGLRQTQKFYFRFDIYHRLLHGLLMGTFLGLAATGLPLRFSYTEWAATLAHTFGGFRAILFFHKTFALLLTLTFLLHIGHVLYRAVVRREAGIFWGPTSMVPQPRDLVQIFQHFRWFLGLGPKPRFDRFTYWEKFDYWAVFWGMAIIGTTGYMLWFPAFFARFLPGWVFNIALLVHGEEALLAVWFIFTIHFFNTHLRPEKFPMDLVIFTGRVREEEMRAEHPLEYERLAQTGVLETLESDPPPRWMKNFGRIVGFTTISIGFILFALTIWAYLKG